MQLSPGSAVSMSPALSRTFRGVLVQYRSLASGLSTQITSSPGSASSNTGGKFATFCPVETSTKSFLVNHQRKSRRGSSLH